MLFRIRKALKFYSHSLTKKLTWLELFNIIKKNYRWCFYCVYSLICWLAFCRIVATGKMDQLHQLASIVPRLLRYFQSTACVNVLMDNGVFVEINTLEIEDAAANDMYQRSALDWLVYNAPVEYAELILNGDLSQYLKNVTVYKHLESWLSPISIVQ